MLAVDFTTPTKIQQVPDYYKARSNNRGGFLKELTHQIMTKQSRHKQNGNAYDANAKNRPLTVTPTA